jgi:hypothetical protein
MRSNTITCLVRLMYALIIMLTSNGIANARIVYIQNGSNLQAAIDQAKGGDTLLVKPGTYGSVKIQNKNFSASNPVIVKKDGTGTVIINGSNWKRFEVINCSYWVFEGLKIDAGGVESSGLWIKDSHHIIIKNNEIKNIGHVGIHVNTSSYIDIIGNEIAYTGRTQPAYGEGIYIGSGSTSAPFPDRNDYIWIEDNLIYECGYGEGINIKSEVFHCTVRGNTVRNIHPSTTSQLNQAAISINDAHLSVQNNYLLTTSRDTWVENNTVYAVSGGQRSGWNNGIFFGGIGVHVLNNTVYDCTDNGIIGHHWNNLGILNYVYGNTTYNNGTNVYINPVLNVKYENPSPNPNTPQEWYIGETVSFDTVYVTGVSIIEPVLKIKRGQKSTLTYTLTPSNTSMRKVIWSSSDSTVAVVDNDGTVYAGLLVDSCMVYIKTDYGNFTDSIMVHVEPGHSIHSFSDQQIPNYASNLIDGNISDDYRWSAEIFPQWAIIDLGEEKTFSGAKVYTYQSRAYQYRVEVSNNPDDNFRTIIDRTSNISSAQPITDTIPPVSARYIKITVTGANAYSGQWSSINEFELIEGIIETSINDISIPRRKDAGKGDILLFPNPVNNRFFTIKTTKPEIIISGISISDLKGSIVFSKKIEHNAANEFTIDAKLNAGIYIAYFNSNEGLISSSFIVE